MASSFVLGRSEFNHIQPGTVVPFQVDGSFGRIQSVQLDNMCLDVESEQPFPVDRDCNPIEVKMKVESAKRALLFLSKSSYSCP